jgi:zinc transporter 1/2/3
MQAILSILFAITTPIGIIAGLLVFTGRGSDPDPDRMKLTQGVMSAISAGMLIYAACVEMLAADFVMDSHLWRSGVRRQAMALLALLAGAVCMTAVD